MRCSRITIRLLFGFNEEGKIRGKRTLWEVPHKSKKNEGAKSRLKFPDSLSHSKFFLDLYNEKSYYRSTFVSNTGRKRTLGGFAMFFNSLNISWMEIPNNFQMNIYNDLNKLTENGMD